MSIDTHDTMPNHFHGIIVVGMQSIARKLWPHQGVIHHAPTLGNIVRVFKAITTRRIRTRSNNEFAWQRNYHEHIIRNEAELHCIRQYIIDNPMHWETDRENPHQNKNDACRTAL
jgi:REP element-mobilizing transposase RayT